jgi:hypothetical protein
MGRLGKFWAKDNVVCKKTNAIVAIKIKRSNFVVKNCWETCIASLFLNCINPSPLFLKNK